MRSSRNGIQPTWLSAYAIFSVGYRSSVRDQIQSQSEPSAFCAFNDIETASGASADVVGMLDDEPMCIDTVVSVSAHASHSGSHFPLCRDG
jgi:hypothetical protein